MQRNSIAMAQLTHTTRFRTSESNCDRLSVPPFFVVRFDVISPLFRDSITSISDMVWSGHLLCKLPLHHIDEGNDV